MEKQVTLNVIPKETLKPLIGQVTNMVANTIKSTFGPYGQNTLIQTVSTVYATKDGWTVMQNVRVTDEKGECTPAVNAIKKLIQDTAQAVLLNAGDGTSTVVLAAAALNNKMTEYLRKNSDIDSRTIENTLKKCVGLILSELQSKATMVTDENMEDVIHKIALVSTNWDEEISGLIRDIYVRTKNPIIKVMDSGNLNTFAEYVEGYELVGNVELPNYYYTSPAKGMYEAKNPLILTFGSAIHARQLKPLLAIASTVKIGENRDVVILSPTFDLDFLNQLKATNMSRLRNNEPVVNLVPIQYYAKTGVDQDCAEDFAVLTGSSILSDKYEEVERIFDELAEYLSNEEKRKKSKGNPVLVAVNKIHEIAGTCETLMATDKYIMITGLTNKNEKEFQRRKESLENELEEKRKEFYAESTLTGQIRVKRLRLGKMQCNMGIIKVGGFGSAHLKERKDAIDDATRACEVAYQNGFIPDGGTAILFATLDAFDKMKEDPKFGELDADFLNMFIDAFGEVLEILYENRYSDLSTCREIINSCIDKRQSYNLITETYEEGLITPVDVCKEVLTGCLRLVLISATSNQFIFQNEDDLIREIQRDGYYDERFKSMREDAGEE